MTRKIGSYLLIIFLSIFADSAFCALPDRELEDAYRTLFTKEFGYTLIGEKPVSIEDAIESEYLHTHPEALKKFLTSLQQTFEGSKTIILKIFFEDDNAYFLEIIHKSALKKLVLTNQKLQSLIVQNFKNEADFYTQIEDPDQKMTDVLKNDAYLKGILLGYGDANSLYFCRRCELAKHLRKFPLVRLFPFCEGLFVRMPNFPGKLKRPNMISSPHLNPEFSSLEEEWRWMNQVQWDLKDEREAVPPYFIALPFYICCHHSDSEAIRENYKQARIKLAELFDGTSFQDAISQLLFQQVALHPKNGLTAH